MSREWEASTYHRIADPQALWNAGVLERLSPRGDERVLDAGCGSGRGTAELVKLLPRGRAVGVDASADMVSVAQETLGDSADVFQCDLLELELDEPVDAVVSTATFHWIPDHDRLFQRLADVLKPGGRLETDCGGFGNVRTALGAMFGVMNEERFEAAFADWSESWYFAKPGETVPRLENAGFDVIDCSLTERPSTVKDAREFVRVVQAPVALSVLDPSEHDDFIDAVMERLGDNPVFEYVRLNISARKRAA